MLDTVVIGQDEVTELHVQAAMQGGRRHVDIRIWRRGPTGFAPSRNALTLDAADLEALQQGMIELLEASDAGKQVARVVWDKDEGRRLRAETEPFGTRYLARLGFWQRVRDTWKPVGDGLVLQADQLKPLQDVLETFKPRLAVAAEPQAEPADEPHDETLRRWPSPGADWITIDHDRISFHPRGVRVTASVVDGDEGHDGHRLLLKGWRRQETIWVPDDSDLVCSITTLDGLLLALHTLLERPDDVESAELHIDCEDGSKLWPHLVDTGGTRSLCIDVLPAADAEPDLGFQTRLAMPADHLPRFGRMLAHAGILLMGSMTEEERERLRERQDLETPELVEDAPAALAEAAQHEEEAPDTSRRGGYVLEIQEPSRQLLQNIILAARPPERQLTVEGAESDADPTTDGAVNGPAATEHLLTDVQLGRHTVLLYVTTDEPQMLLLRWERRCLRLPIDHLETLLSNLRVLYYDALRGRRGPAVSVGESDPVTLSVRHDGHQMLIMLGQSVQGAEMCLTFPVGDTPVFLNEAGTALARM